MVNEIPSAFVSETGEDPQIILMPKQEGQYRVEGVGVDSGTYSLAALEVATATNPVVLKVFTGTTTLGQSYQFTVGTPPLQEAGGQVVLEAEQFTFQLGRSDRAWSTQTNLAGYVGSGYQRDTRGICDRRWLRSPSNCAA